MQLFSEFSTARRTQTDKGLRKKEETGVCVCDSEAEKGDNCVFSYGAGSGGENVCSSEC